jgi:hypothetical protein
MMIFHSNGNTFESRAVTNCCVLMRMISSVYTDCYQQFLFSSVLIRIIFTCAVQIGEENFEIEEPGNADINIIIESICPLSTNVLATISSIESTLGLNF